MKISIKDALEKGVSAHKNGRLEEASYYYEQILKSQPSHPDANHNFGGIVAMFGDPSRAIPYLKIAVEADPRQAQYWYSYINTLIKAGETQQAKAALELGMRTVLEPGDQSRSLQRQLNPQTHLGFFYDYLRQMGVFKSDNENITDGDGQPRPKLTDSFLHWFETQDWSSLKLLELGAGNSTLYFSKFFKNITSLETDGQWYKTISSRVPKNVSIQKTNSIIDSIGQMNTRIYDVVLIDCAQNRAKIVRHLEVQGFAGAIFFDNTEWYRRSVEILMEKDFVEIPFFGLKPTEDWVSSTSLLIKANAVKSFFKPDWKKIPKLSAFKPQNGWDNEFE